MLDENARGYFNSPQIEAASAQRCGLVRAAVDESLFSSMTPSSVAHRSDGNGWTITGATASQRRHRVGKPPTKGSNRAAGDGGANAQSSPIAIDPIGAIGARSGLGFSNSHYPPKVEQISIQIPLRHGAVSREFCHSLNREVAVAPAGDVRINHRFDPPKRIVHATFVARMIRRSDHRRRKR
jgi:hypothetical protein